MITLSTMFCVICVVFLNCWSIACNYVSVILFLLRDLYPINANKAQMLFNSTAHKLSARSFLCLLGMTLFHIEIFFSAKFTALLWTQRLGYNFLSEAELDFRWKVFVRVF